MVDWRTERDRALALLIVAVAVTILHLLAGLFARENLTAEVNTFIQGIIFAFIGGYGGVRGKGSPTKEENTLGLPAGTIRFLLGVIYVLVGVSLVLFVTDLKDFGYFYVTVGFALVGVSLPALRGSRSTS